MTPTPSELVDVLWLLGYPYDMTIDGYSPSGNALRALAQRYQAEQGGQETLVDWIESMAFEIEDAKARLVAV